LKDKEETKKSDAMDAAVAVDLFIAAKTSRSQGFDSAWEECIKYDEHYESQLNRDRQSSELGWIVEIPFVKMQNDKRAGSLGRIDVRPDIHSEVSALDSAAEIRGIALRWGWRVSHSMDAIRLSARDICMINHAVLQVRWDRTSFDGVGAPRTIFKDFRSIWIDPSRKDIDVNVDCRWIFESQRYSIADAKLIWPDYFDGYEDAETINSGDAETSDIRDESMEFYDSEGGYIEIIRAEFAKVVGNKKIVYEGILDPNRKKWIEGPVDNKLGVYSYILIDTSLKRGEAYPVPGNSILHHLADLANVFGSLAVTHAIRSGNPDIWLDKEDLVAQESLKNSKASEPGGVKYYEKAPPVVLNAMLPTVYLAMFREMDARIMESGGTTSISRGEVPQANLSGRAIDSLQAYSQSSLEEFGDALSRGARGIAVVIDAMNREYIIDYRNLTDIQDGSPLSVPFNVDEKHADFANLSEKYVTNPNSPMLYMSARIAEKDGSVSASTIYDADKRIVEGGITQAQVVRVINDIKLGRYEVTVNLVPRMSPTEEVNYAIMLYKMQACSLTYLLKKMSVENPSQVAREALEQNKELAIGKVVTSNPLLLKMATTPEFLNQVQALLSESLGAGEQQEQVESQ